MKLNPPKFYYTVHPADTLRSRLIPGVRIMVVATAYWDCKKNKFRIRRPPADHIKSKAGRHARLAIDSGGFTAHKKWGKYPWSHEQYIEFIRKMSRDVTLDGHACPPYFCAVMDYACEREVNRSTYKSNMSRIVATIQNEIILRQLAPNLPWLGVLQGNTLEERAWDITQRQELELLYYKMGIGSICGRSPRESKEVIRFYMQQLPHLRYHAFGLDIRAFDGADDMGMPARLIFWAIASWDSYTWCWGRGMKQMRDPQRQHIEGETWSQYTLRLAQQFEKNTLNKRLYARRQYNFFDLALLAKPNQAQPKK